MFSVASGEEQEISFSEKVSSPLKWTAETPELYRLDIELSQKAWQRTTSYSPKGRI
ncbi:MAG: hypothetical protein ACLUE2_04055 [Bacteroides cellulosilyticus]